MGDIFISHTKRDKEFCDAFDSVVARVKIKAYRSEYEKIVRPAWKPIKDAINKSSALFLLIGKELVESQDSEEPGWRHTQNWIAYEVGVASQRGIDVWVICDDVLINFPVPYINNYLTTGLKEEKAFDYLRDILEQYKIGWTFPYPYTDLLDPKQKFGVFCPFDNCKLEFNLHVALLPGDVIRCPQCLREMEFRAGHLIPSP